MSFRQILGVKYEEVGTKLQCQLRLLTFRYLIPIKILLEIFLIPFDLSNNKCHVCFILMMFYKRHNQFAWKQNKSVLD